MDWLIWYTVIRCLGKTVIVNEYTKEKKRNKGTGKQRKTAIMPDGIIQEGYGTRSTRNVSARSNNVRHPLERSGSGWSEPASRICHLHQGGSSRPK